MKMNMDNLLDLERRTGVKDDDLNDFVMKASEIEAKIRALKDGRIPLEELQREEDEEDREAAREAALRAKKKLEYAAMEKKRQQREKQEEHEKWWLGANALFGKNDNENIDDSIQSVNENESKREAMLKKYETNYSRWDSIKFTDPVSMAEDEEARKKEEEVKNKLFEEQNAEFCNQVKDDISKRNQVQEKKKETANAARLRGNRYFKLGKYEQALKTYRESLQSKAYEPTTLLNIAQVYLKLKQYADAEEFTNRALFIVDHASPLKPKILSRRAAARRNLGNLTNAQDDLTVAQNLAPDNTAIASELAALIRLRQDAENEARVSSMLSCPSQDTNKDEALAFVNKIHLNDALLDDKQQLHQLAIALRCSSEARILWRVRGGIDKLCHALSVVDKHQTNLPLLLGALCAAITGETKSKAMCLQIIDTVTSILQANINKEHRATACELLAELSDNETGPCKISACQVLKKSSKSICAVLENQNDIISSAHAARALKALSTEQTYRKILIHANAVRALGRGLTLHQDAKDATCYKELFAQETALTLALPNLFISCASGLAQLALEAPARPHFAIQVNDTETVVGALLHVAQNSKIDAECRAVALVAVANACYQCQVTRIAAESAAAVAVCFALIISKNNPSTIIRLRATQALSRLIVAGGPKGTAASTLQASVKTIPALAKELDHKNCSNEQAEALLRCIAGVESPQLYQDHHATLSIAKVLPEPHKDIYGQVTAETIIIKSQSTHNKHFSANAIGNACKALVPCVNQPPTLKYLMDNLNLTDRLVAALATFNDPSLRKNVAVLLAKIIANEPKAKDRVRELRGIEMLTAIGNSLISSS